MKRTQSFWDFICARILMAAFERVNQLNKDAIPDFYLYVDEFQNFSTPDFATILSRS